MSDLYKDVRKHAKARPPRRRLFVIVGSAVAFLLLMAGLITYTATAPKRFTGFISELSRSTLFAYRKSTLCAVYPDGTTLDITGTNDYELYQYLSLYGMTGEKLLPPSEEPDLVLEYGDGGVLSLWSSGEKGMCVRFARPGYRYVYVCSDLSLPYLTHGYLSPERNLREE